MALFPTTVVLATDGSKHAGAAAAVAVETCRATASALQVVHVAPVGWSPFTVNPAEFSAVEAQFHQVLEEANAHIEQLGGTVDQAHLRTGHAAEEIVALCREVEAGLLVIGTRGQGRVQQAVLGSVSAAVVREAPCPVLVARADAAP
ncbi:MAG: universal stress protein [Actinomycetota bacterium]|nr:universal stress protein [Actinomycetota bacterium]